MPTPKKEAVSKPVQKTGSAQSAMPIGETKETKKKRRKWPWILLLILLFLVAILIAAFFLLNRPPETVSLDNLQNMTVEEATDYLETEELILGEVEESYDDGCLEKGLIIDIMQCKCTQIERGSVVDMLVSLGEEPFKMSDFIGSNYDYVVSDFEKAGFENINKEFAYSDLAEGTVIKQSVEN